MVSAVHTAESSQAPAVDRGTRSDLYPASATSSALYSGWVRHRRYRPFPHSFRYKVFQVYLDLDHIDEAFAGRWLWSVNRRNVAEFRRSDFFGDSAKPLVQEVRDAVSQACGRPMRGPVRLLTHLRMLGHVANPVSLYYCHGADGTLEAILAEITNTPWGERHAYILDTKRATRRGRIFEWDFDKAFHVSPFLPVQRRYRWRLHAPDQELRVHMEVFDGDALDFDATLVFARKELDGRSLARALLQLPLMTAKVTAAIYWQALRLKWKGAQYFPKPDFPKTEASASSTESRP